MENALRLPVDDHELKGDDERCQHRNEGSSVQQTGDEEETEDPEQSGKQHDESRHGSYRLDAVLDDLECSAEFGLECLERRTRRKEPPQRVRGDEEPGDEDEGDDVRDHRDPDPGLVCQSGPGDAHGEQHGDDDRHLPAGPGRRIAQDERRLPEGKRNAGDTGYPAEAVDHPCSIAFLHDSDHDPSGVVLTTNAPARANPSMASFPDSATDNTTVR